MSSPQFKGIIPLTVSSDRLAEMQALLKRTAKESKTPLYVFRGQDLYPLSHRSERLPQMAQSESLLVLTGRLDQVLGLLAGGIFKLRKNLFNLAMLPFERLSQVFKKNSLAEKAVLWGGYVVSAIVSQVALFAMLLSAAPITVPVYLGLTVLRPRVALSNARRFLAQGPAVLNGNYLLDRAQREQQQTLKNILDIRTGVLKKEPSAL